MSSHNKVSRHSNPASTNGRAKAQGNGNGNGSKVVKVGKVKTLKRWDLSAKPSSDKFKKFQTNAHMKSYLEDALQSGKRLADLGTEFKVSGSRIFEMCAQLGLNVKALKARAKKGA